MNALTEEIVNLEGRLGEGGQSGDSVAAEEMEPEVTARGEERALVREEEKIAPEIRVAIAAAAIAVLGRNARVRSAKAVRDHVSPWTQQGRAIVQASHNLRSKR